VVVVHLEVHERDVGLERGGDRLGPLL